MPKQKSDPFKAIVDYTTQKGLAPVKDKIVQVRVDEHWEFAVNGHKEPKEVKMAGSGRTQKVAPFTVYVEFNGWPAGILDPFGGSFAAGGLANADSFCEALRKGERF